MRLFILLANLGRILGTDPREPTQRDHEDIAALIGSMIAANDENRDPTAPRVNQDVIRVHNEEVRRYWELLERHNQEASNRGDYDKAS